jgi:type II secretory pathway pseudopilin PulG
MSKRYSAFTLVEMLIVMGILIILMAVGITAGRFAINRANDVAHQNAADQIYTAMQAYYTDHREFPEITNFGTAMAVDGALNPYMGDGEFTGGTDATFYYWRSTLGQSILICVSKGGLEDETGRGYYCTGNAFGAASDEATGITTKDVEANDTGAPKTPSGGTVTFDLTQDWNGSDSVWVNPV